jgi:hypothetical protein
MGAEHDAVAELASAVADASTARLHADGAWWSDAVGVVAAVAVSVAIAAAGIWLEGPLFIRVLFVVAASVVFPLALRARRLQRQVAALQAANAVVVARVRARDATNSAREPE